jgi:hypothetical protein
LAFPRFAPILLCAGLLAAQTQSAQPDRGRVEGTVLNTATSQPVVKAWVTLRAQSGAYAATSSVTDAQGHFVFMNLSGGAYWIEAQRDNFLKDSGAPLTLAPGEVRKDLLLRITPYGAIAGHVRTEEGDPISNLRVTAMVYEYRTGGRQLVSRSSTTTNDLGEYRLFGLIAGKYFLRTEQRTTPGAGDIYPATYYPGATDASGAAPLELGAGQELRDKDLVLYRTHAWTIRGKVAIPPGASRIVVSLNENGMTSAGVDETTGAFELRGVAPGAYILTAYGGAGEKTYIARQPIQVTARDIDDIELRLTPYVDLKGVLRIEGRTSIEPSQLSIGMQGITASVKENGTFTFRDVPPDIYRPTVGGAEDLFVKGIRCGPADVTESGVDLTGGAACDLAITVSANGGQIQGSVEDDQGQPVKAVTVTLVAQGTRRTDLFKQTTSDAGGHFKLVGVAPGSYRLYAWEAVDFNAVRYDPDFVKPYESLGQSLQIVEAARENVSLRQIGKSAGR